ncbi:hypothetical protein BH10BAC5_BH10BAC5_08020 [soil metagenome]
MDQYSENIISVLSEMNRKELKKFELFLKSPYYNSRTKLVSLFTYLKKYAPDFNSKNYSKAKAFEHLYKGREYNQGIINEAYSTLFILSIQFLKLQKAESNKVVDILLLDTLREKHLDPLFAKMSKRIDVFFANIPDNRNNLIDQYDLILAKYNYYVSQYSKSKAKNTENELQLAGEALRKLALFFITNSTALFLNTYFTSKSFNKKSQGEFALLFDQKIIDRLLDGIQWDKKEKILISLYKKLYAVIKNPDSKKDFEQYKEYIDKNISRLDRTEVLLHFHFLISLYSNIFDKTNDIEYRFRTLALRETILFEGIYISEFNQEYLHLDFRNIILDILNLKLPDHMYNLIPCVSSISKKYQDTFHNYVQANYCFLKNEFEKALHYANLVSGIEKRLLIDMDMMRIKIYLINCEFIRCVDRVNTLKKYLSEFQAMNLHSKERYKAFLSAIKKSILLIEKQDSVEFHLYINQLIEGNDFIFKDWLLSHLHSISEKGKLKISKSKIN